MSATLTSERPGAVVDDEGEILVAEEGEEEPSFPDVRVNRRWVVNRDGKDFVLFAGLVDMLHQLSEGFFDVQTTLVQAPSGENGTTAIVTARVVVFDAENTDVVRRVASGIGDASPGNVSRQMAPHLIRMAETRACARALRLLTNVGMTTLEELGPKGGDAPAPSPAVPARAPSSLPGLQPPQASQPPQPERIQVEGKWYDRDQVQKAFHQRVKEARRHGLIGNEVETLPVGQTPLPMLVGLMQSWRRQIEEREGALS